MTKQTLTAERAALQLLGKYGSTINKQRIMEALEAYAAQQNAELVAQIKPLKAAEQSYCRRISSLEKEIKSLQRSAAIRDTKLAKAKAHADLMQAENERLKQQLAWQPIETFPDFYPAPLLLKHEHPEEGVEYGLAEWSCSGECWVDPKFTGIKENYTHWAYIDKEGV